MTPLFLGRAEELIDEDLRAVGEVAELCLPDDEAFRKVARVAVLESQRRRLGQRRVDAVEELALLRSQVVQGHVLLLGLHVDQDGVAVIERPPARILSGEADADALAEQGADGQGFRHAPVHGALPLGHLASQRPLAVFG